MENDPILAHERVLDNVTIEDTHNYSVYTTIGLREFGNFYIKLEFKNLDSSSIVEVDTLFNLNKALKFSSDLVKKEGYPITHIVAEEFHSAHPVNSMIWECISDHPGPSLIID